MFKITFRYADQYSNWEWIEQECVMPSVQDCIDCYGLGDDCEYEILTIEHIDD